MTIHASTAESEVREARRESEEKIKAIAQERDGLLSEESLSENSPRFDIAAELRRLLACVRGRGRRPRRGAATRTLKRD